MDCIIKDNHKMFKKQLLPNISIFRRILIATFLEREHGPSCIFSIKLLEILTESEEARLNCRHVPPITWAIHPRAQLTCNSTRTCNSRRHYLAFSPKQEPFPRSVIRVDLKAKYLGGTVGSAMGDTFGETAFPYLQSDVLHIHSTEFRNATCREKADRALESTVSCPSNHNVVYGIV